MFETSSTCLILLAHGSAESRWRTSFEKMAESLRAVHGHKKIKLAYLQACSPSLLEIAQEAATEGFSNLLILPMFMAGGGHVERHIPELAKKIQQTFPELQIAILPPAGEHPQFISALREITEKALS